MHSEFGLLTSPIAYTDSWTTSPPNPVSLKRRVKTATSSAPSIGCTLWKALVATCLTTDLASCAGKAAIGLLVRAAPVEPVV